MPINLKVESLKREIAKTLSYYLKNDIKNWEKDHDVEVQSIVSDIEVLVREVVKQEFKDLCNCIKINFNKKEERNG